MPDPFKVLEKIRDFKFGSGFGMQDIKYVRSTIYHWSFLFIWEFHEREYCRNIEKGQNCHAREGRHSNNILQYEYKGIR